MQQLEAQKDFLTEEQAAFVAKQGYKPYTQVKFGPYNDVVGTTINANDIVLMRIEEMYLIAAEAYAEAGNRAEGEKYFKELLNNRLESGVQAYLTDYASNPQEAVYFQRRIELWGEGVIWFDVMRLNKEWIVVDVVSRMQNVSSILHRLMTSCYGVYRKQNFRLTRH